MLKKRDTDRLCQTFLFRGCDPAAVLSPLDPGEIRLQRYGAGEVIYTADSFSREIGILLSGRVRVTKSSGLVVSELMAGDLFGAAAIYSTGEEYVSTLTVRQPARVLFLSEAAVKRLVEEDPRIRRNYLEYLTERIRFLSAKVETLTRDSSSAKLRGYLLRHADPDGLVRPILSMTELAARLNISRASLYRELDLLIDAHLLVKEGKQLRVLQPDRLEDTKGE